MLFPDGLYIENNEFRTGQICPILRLISEKENVKSSLAGERGFEPQLY
jgi:hypothetical protein